MAKSKTIFTCNECGAQFPKWMGRCSECGQWDTVVEELQQESAPKGRTTFSSAKPKKITEITEDLRSGALSTGVSEFDRVLGGGLLRGASVLVGGDPGIGKSTLLLQAVSNMAQAGETVLYVSGEESAPQIKERAGRLGAISENLYLVSETNVNVIKNHMESLLPRAVVVDSVQMLFRPEITSAPGSVSQIRECSAEIIYAGKNSGIGVFLVGHITKQGAIAGPKVLEHMVDTVLYFEGDRHHFYRLLRTYKNRFGSATEIGVFEMTGQGLTDVPDAAGLFLDDTQSRHGTAVTGIMEGTRTLYVEIQALASRTVVGVPKRKTSGFDFNRSAMLVAVLEKRAGLQLAVSDVFVNAVGGISVTEPGADLAAVMAIASSFLEKPVPENTLILGEVGLGGEVRPVSRLEERVKEAGRFGIKKAVVSAAHKTDKISTDIEIIKVGDVCDALELLEGGVSEPGS